MHGCVARAHRVRCMPSRAGAIGVPGDDSPGDSVSRGWRHDNHTGARVHGHGRCARDGRLVQRQRCRRSGGPQRARDGALRRHYRDHRPPRHRVRDHARDGLAGHAAGSGEHGGVTRDRARTRADSCAAPASAARACIGAAFATAGSQVARRTRRRRATRSLLVGSDGSDGQTFGALTALLAHQCLLHRFLCSLRFTER